MRYEYSIEYHFNTMLNKGFKGLKNYALKKINNQRLIKENTYRNELRIKKRTLDDIIKHAIQSKEAIKNFRAEFAKLKNL